MTTTNLNTLKINYLTQDQYEAALENDSLNENELYFTPGSSAGLTEIISYIQQYSPTKTSDLTNDSGYAQKSTVQITLAVDSWSSNSQTVSVTGVTALNDVLVTPTTASRDEYISAGVWCASQAAGTLTFTCEEVPTSALVVNVLILT